MNMIDDFLNNLETTFQEQSRREIPTSEIGEAVIEWLRGVDDVAYVRFASVYREFRDVREFMSELQTMIEQKKPYPLIIHEKDRPAKRGMTVVICGGRSAWPGGAWAKVRPTRPWGPWW